MLTTITQNKKHTKPLFILILSLLTLFTFTGCKSSEVTDLPSEPIASEPVSEVVSEVASEEVSEEPSESASEEVVEEIDLSLYTTENGKRLTDLIQDMNYDELKIIVWGIINDEYVAGPKAILSSGDSYIIEYEDDRLYLYYPKEMQNVEFNADYIAKDDETENICTIRLYTTGENIEIPITGTDVDGKEYEITVYVTVEE